jgi:hypothetical protein
MKSIIRNNLGQWDLKFNENGTVDVLSFAPNQAKPKWTGLGDVVASATSAVGIKPCGGCKQRQEALNKLVPFENKETNGNQ